MGVQIPPVLVLIVCKTVLAGPADHNAAFTHYENLEWATEHSMMVCRRHEIQLFDPAEGVQLGPDHAPAPALNPNFAMASQCARAGIRLATRLGPEPPGIRLGGSGASVARPLSWISGQERLLVINCQSAATETQ